MMLKVGKIHHEVPKHFVMPNLLLLAGAGQNVGKTSLAVAAIKYFKQLGHKVYGLKITPHFHASQASHIIVQTDEYQISLEKDLSGVKDSSRMLEAGAEEVFFVQTNSDEALPAAFDFVRRMADENVLWVCESGGLRTVVEPGLFLYLKLKGQIPQKASARLFMPLADRIVEFNGVDFDFSPAQITVKDYQLKLINKLP